MNFSLSTSDSSEDLIDAQLIQDIQLLYKSYFQLLVNIVNNDLIDIITFQSAENVYKIFNTLIHGAQSTSAFDTAKICFQIIRKFVNVYGKFSLLFIFIGENF
jgi:hypothetical protein